ncbi:MmpS family transport accessory protein [Gordonia sp. (in: high G+C Gram-positive bacteria)]|uniref:MmpS family transport accessory protein n=1 Tax=Gordonia sp. (in: high G+C Gram-positive bacteria) TaxID=84139 RepID=UPI00262A5A63|nr:MmpS family transport accessory protein [Gordonia sp. (in: high G+C Gram-positive bacteria)]HMS75939.1 MmpS family transport accessory protein [Gordonia sp. (in: high G+C Gram-positive bacteria)]
MSNNPPPQFPQGQYPQQPYGQQPYGQQPYGGQYPPQMPPARKRKKWPWILGGIILLFVAMVGGCVALIGGAANEIDKEMNREVIVTYRVTGTGTGSITWTDKDFNMAQETDAPLPWEKQVTVSGFGKIASLTVTNSSDDGATSTCEIVVDGEVKYTQTAKGPFASANCSGSVG